MDRENARGVACIIGAILLLALLLAFAFAG